MSYRRADFAPLRDTVYGVGFHWTTATVPREGDPLPHEEAVAAFDVGAFVEQAVEMGAGHVLFTVTHSKHHICGPNPEADRVLPGRTCERDLILELADGLGAAGIRLLAYYNSGIHVGDPEWREAVGAERDEPSEFYDNWSRVVGWMGEHYGPRLAALWIDGGYELEALGDTPWERLTRAAKAGHPDRLICYNPGIERHHLYTPCQDYWAGEVCRLNYLPRGELTPAGLPWFAFLSWHGDSRKPSCGEWVMNAENRALDWHSPPAESAATFLRGFQRAGGTVAFNLFCYQDGSIYDSDFEVMKRLRTLIRG
jgi:hypothetical protein